MATCTVTGISSRAGRGNDAERCVRRLQLAQARDRPPARCPSPSRTPSLIAAFSSAAGFLRHAEAPGPERFVDVLGRRARQRELEVVDDAGAVRRERRDEPALHQIDQDRRRGRS